MEPASSKPSLVLRALEHLPGQPPRGRAAAAVRAGDFCADGQLPLGAVSVAVQGAGSLGQPVTPEAARALHAASTPARHGLREATLLDKRVRDTGEIGADALTLHWAEGALPALLADVARALGLERLEARLHNLLVYGEGQFFKPHQDTEKHPGMVATLVLAWPSAHIGGELRVRHSDRETRFASQHLQARALRWFAFYADCRHEVLPVTEGWRVVLTFDLVVPADLDVPRVPVPPVLLAALRAQFDADDRPRRTPWALLLDHEYTQHGLRWTLLKGEDRPRAAALRAAAEALGLVVHLALAEIHETWSATVGGWGARGDVSPEPEELIDEDMVLDFWVDSADRPLQRTALRLNPDDTESFSDTDESFLVNEEYEGYMGNYGETLDYWYRRAALVIQTPLAAELSRFRTEFDAVLADALALARGNRVDELALRLHAAAPALAGQCREQGRALLVAYAELAAALPDTDQARALCEGFAWESLTPEDAPVLARLARIRGTPWMLALVQAWTAAAIARHRLGWDLGGGGSDRVALWPQPLGAFVEACRDDGLDVAVVDAMLERSLETLTTSAPELARISPADRSASLGKCLRVVCELATALQGTPATEQALESLLDHVRARPVLYPSRSLRPLLQALPPGAAARPEARALHAAVVESLRQALAQPEPTADDHRLDEIEWTCRCNDCRPVIDWAMSAAASPLTLPMAEARRQHVQSSLKRAAAPIGIETLRQGSPYKLVLRKPTDLHAKRRAQRQAWRDDLAALGAAPS